MLAEYMIHEVLNQIHTEYNLSDAQPKTDYDAPNRYYRSIENSISIYCWFTSKGSTQLSVYSDSLSTNSSLFTTTDFINGQTTAVHQHNYIELAYVVSGTFHQQIAGKDFYLKQGEILLTNQSTPHCEYIHAHDSIVLFLNIQNAVFASLFYYNGKKHISNFICELLVNKKESYSYLHFLPKKYTLSTPDILEHIVDEIRKKEPGSTHILPGYIIRLFTYIAQEYQFLLKKEAQEQLKLLLFQDIENYIRQNYCSITVEKLQEKYHYNADYFNRLIKKFTGQTYSQFRQNIRLEAAHLLLGETSLTVENIARQTGYENLGYFYRIFEEKYCVTPGTYRRQLETLKGLQY